MYGGHDDSNSYATTSWWKPTRAAGGTGVWGGGRELRWLFILV